MTDWRVRAEQAFVAASPLYLRAERLRVATATRREALPQDHMLSCWRGAGVYAAVTLFEDSRFYPGHPPAPTAVRLALRVAGVLAQVAVSLLVAPYCGVVVGMAYLRGGTPAALDAAAAHFMPLYLTLLAANVGMWAGVSIGLNLGVCWLLGPPAGG